MMQDDPWADPAAEVQPGTVVRFVLSTLLILTVLLAPIVFVIGTIVVGRASPGGLCATWIGIVIGCHR